jgi:hypothetical protein
VAAGAGRAAGQQRDNRSRPKALRQGVAADGTPGIVYDKLVGSDRWAPAAVRPEVVEFIAGLIERSALTLAWDSLALARATPDSEFEAVRTLADSRAELIAEGKSARIATDLGETEERYLVRLAIRKMIELRQLEETAGFMLLRLVGGPDRLRTEYLLPPELRAAIKAAWRDHPDWSLGRMAQKFGVVKDTARRIKQEAMSTLYDD